MKKHFYFHVLGYSHIHSYKFLLAFSFVLAFVANMQGYAQTTKIVANQITFTSPDDKMTSLVGCGGLGLSPCYAPTVQNPGNSLTDNDQFARVLASPGLVAGLASYDGELELQFPSTLPAETWSYVRIGADESLLQALLGGSLGELLSDVLGSVLLGNQEIEIQARNSSGVPVFSRTSTQGFDTDRVRLVQDGVGNYFLAIKPNAAYERIRLINRSVSLVGLGSEYTLDVYNAFYLDGADACGEFRFTSFDGEGISLDLLGAGVDNAENAIDSDLNSYSEISIGTLGVGASMFQSVYYETPSAPEDYFKVKLGVANAGVLTADLIGGIEVRAYNGSNLVFIQKLSGGLINGLDVLGLLQSGSTVTLPFGPGVAFDRVTVGYTSVVSLNALSNSPIRLYDVQRFGAACPDPDPIPLPTATEPMLSNSSCDATVLAFENANFPLNTVDGNNDTYTTLSASSGIALGVGDYEGFVELGFDSRAAGTSSYVRIDFDEEVLLGLLDGTAGELLGGVVDNVLFGSHYFTVEVKNNGSQVFESSSNNGFFNQPVKIVQDKNNHYYVEVTPESAYTSIRITESLGAIAGLGEVRSMNVYHVCTSTGFEPCEQAFATYSESEGISLDLLGLGAAGVVDAGFAIDGDPATASEVSIGAAGLGSSVYQFVNFHSSSAPEDHFRVKLAMEGGNLLTAEILGSIVIKAFDGDTEVYSQGLRDGLISGLDLLGLLQSGGTINLPFGPGLSFDRVAVGIESVVSANVIQNPVKIFSIERFSAACPDPELTAPPETIPPFNTSDCAAEVVDWANTNFPLNAVDGNNDSYAVLSASTGTALGLGAYSSHIELRYAAPVAAGETSYVRIEFENDELNALLGGSLGSDLADLLGSVALGDHYFTVTPKTAGGTDIYTASSATGFGNQDVRVVQDESGRFYIAFTADQAYQSVRIDHYLAALIGLDNTATMHVFSMCRETEFDLCEQATFTDFDGSGIAVDLLDITKGGVFNPQNAIDGNSSNYSTINLGIAGIGATVYQNIYFKTKSQNTDALRIRVQLDEPGILNLDLAGSYRLILYNGNDEVYNESLQDALINNLDLLGLLNSGGIQELLIEPGVVYDRVSFGLQSIAAINTSAPIRLYGISRISDGCPDPDVADPPYLSPVCAEELIDASFADNLANLFDGNFNSFATINSSGGALLTGIGAYSGHVTLGYGDGVVVPAGTTSYMRIDTDASLLDALLGGSVGGILSDLLNTVVLGDHYFTVSANDTGGTPLFTASSDNSFAGFNDQVKIVQDALGRYYLAITPNAAYNSITVEDHTAGGLFGEDNSINIYGLCYDTGAEACATGFTTSFDGSGITVDAGTIGSYGVTNAERALDNNNNDDYSEISLGTLGVAGSIQQNIQFRQTIPAGGAFKIKLGVGAGVLDADVFGRIDVVGYLDGVEVYDETLENAVLGNVNLVDLFNNGANEEIRISPGVAVDEVAIRLRSLVSVTAVPNVRLYYILQDCETPDFQAWESYVIDGDPSLTSVSGGETIVYTIHVRNTGTVPMTDYLITDAIPANTTYVSGGVENGGVVSFDAIDIAPGETVAVSFTVLVDENLTDVEFVSNVALVKSLPEDPGVETYPALDNENPTDPDESGDTGTDIPVDAIFSAELWKAVTVDGDANVTAVSGGETLNYTIFIRNTGNQDLTDLSISDALPTGITYVSGGALVGNEVNFSLPGLAVGATSTVGSFTATVDADLTGIDEIINIAVANSADLSAPIESYPPLDNSNPTEPDTAADPGTVLDVTPVHAVDFDKIGLSNNADSDAKAIVGDIITYTLTVTNTGNKLLTDISVADQIPANTTVVDNGGGTAGTGTLTFDIASLAVGAMQEFTFTAQVDAVTGSDPIVNNAEAFYTDEVGGNASETAQHSMPTDCMVIDAGDITLTADQSAICVGESTILHASLNGISIPNPEFRWYLDASLTGAYFAGADYEVSPTASTTYYVTVVAEGYCFSTPAATISVNVNSNATASDIITTDVAILLGESTTFSATSSTVSNPVFRFYSDAALMTELTDLTVSPIITTIYYVTVSGDGVCENTGADTGTITVTVNQSATADDVNLTVTPGTPLVASLPISPGSGDIIEITPDLSEVPAGVTVTIDLDGTVSIDVPAGYTGPTSFEVSYEVTDENGLSDTGTITVTVNQSSTADDVSFAVTPGTPFVGTLPISQGSGDIIEITPDLSEVPAGVTVTIDLDGTVSIDVPAGYTGPTSFEVSYKVTDENGLSNTGIITVTVNTSPVVGDVSFAVTPGTPFVGTLPISPGSGDIVEITPDLSEVPAGVTVTIDLDGTVNISVPVDYSGPTSFAIPYEVTDENGLSDTGIITVNVNQSSTANDASFAVTPGTPFVGTLPISQGSGDIIEITPDLSGVPAGVTVTIDLDGTVSIDVPAGYTGPASFEVSYEVTDENGLSDSGIITVSVNQSSTADDVSFAVTPGTPLVASLPITAGSGAIVDITPYLSGVPAGVTVTIDLDGTVNISVPVDYSGPTSFEVRYEVTDENGLSDTGIITVTVNTSPVADDVSFTVTPGTPLVASLPITAGSGAIVDITPDLSGVPAGVTVTIDLDGTVNIFVPVDYSGPASFAIPYEVTDENGLSETGIITMTVNQSSTADDASFAVTPGTPFVGTLPISQGSGDIVEITPDLSEVPAGVTVTIDLDGTVNISVPVDYSGPTSFAIPYEVTDENGLSDTGIITVNVNQSSTANDASFAVTPGTPLVASLPITAGSGAIVDITPYLSGVPAGVTVTIDLDGTVNISVPVDYSGPTSFEVRYEVTDENGLSDTGIITVTVNTSPVADDVSFTVTPGTPLVASLPITAGSGAIVDITPDLSGVPAGVTVTIDLDGTVNIFVPVDYSGPASFAIPYEVTDENGLSETGIITMTVNQSSTADDASFAVTPGTPFVGTLPISQGSGDIVEITPDLSEVPAGVTVTIDLDGTVNIDVPAGYTGPTSFEVSYEVTDENGLSDTGIITVNVNQSSTVNDASFTVTPGTPLVASLPITAGSGAIVDITPDLSGVPAGVTVTIDLDGTVSIDVPAGYTGPTSFAIPYEVTDENGLSETGIITMTVNVNGALVAGDVSFAVTPDTPFVGTLPISPGSGDIVEITPDLSGVPVGVTVTIDLDGTVNIDFPAGYTGLTSLEVSYEVTDENGLSDTGTITVTVNTSPVVGDVSFAVTPGTPFVGTLPISQGSGDIVEITPDLSEVPAGVTVTIDLDGTVSIDVPAGYTGPTSFEVSYKVTDENGLSDTGTITVTVNQSSTANDASFAVTPGTPLVASLPITAGSGAIVDITPDLSGVPAGVTVTIALDGTVNISVPVDYRGPTSFEVPYEVTDENGLSSTGTITVTVDQESEDIETILSVIKWTELKTVSVGEMIDYTIRIENIGEAIAYDLIVADSLPSGTMAIETNADGKILEETVVWEIDSLAVGDSLDITVKLIVISDEGSITNRVYVFGRNLLQESSFASEEVTVLAPLSPIDLQISKEVSSSIVSLGDEFEYKISIWNNSNFEANGVIVTDTLPPGLTFIKMSQGQGIISYEETNRVLTWTVESLSANSMESFTLFVIADTEGEITNTAYVESSNTEVDSTNNSSSAYHNQLEFEVPNVFTPNGDGINDFWIIEGLNDLFASNELFIVNRWGVEVFKASNYQNDWNGTNLNGGTYFYQLKVRDSLGSEKLLTGYITIIK